MTNKITFSVHLCVIKEEDEEQSGYTVTAPAIYS